MDPNIAITYLPFSLNSELVLTHSTFPSTAVAATTLKAEIESYSQVSYELNSLSSPGQQITKVLVSTMSSGRIK